MDKHCNPVYAEAFASDQTYVNSQNQKQTKYANPPYLDIQKTELQ